MRLWSIKLEYLDQKGIVALWRESLLAKAVLEGKTKGYRNHPQLERFKNYKEPLKAINTYLSYINEEASKRGFDFDKKKIEERLVDKKIRIGVSDKQLEYELSLLKEKLRKRSEKDYLRIKNEKAEPNQLFFAYHGNIERWERIKPLKEVNKS